MITAVDEPSFFKMILAPRLDLQKLGIPSTFMKKHGEELLDGSSVSLNIPTGEVWKVELVIEKGKAFLQNGWLEFVEFYSIREYHLLVFTYKGNSSFDVFIFDKSTSEIEYPLVHINAGCASKKRKRVAKKSTSSKKALAIVAVPDKVLGFRCALTPDEKNRVGDYQSEHPSFVVKLKPSSVRCKHTLNIPLEFARKYLNKLGNFRLVSIMGKTKMTVKCKTVGGTRVRLTKGWKEFAIDNKLRVNDICVFELIDGAKMTFRFSILLASARQNPAETPEVIELEDD